MSTVYFLSDFGSSDVYAGVVRSLIRQKAPGVDLIDLAHDLPPGDVTHAAYQLYSALPYLETGGVVLAVIDPGVGGERRALAVRGEKLWYVAPDNGLLSLVFDLDPPQGAWELEPSKYVQAPVSNTFHGRDVFAPAAALLAAGFPAAWLGGEVDPGKIQRLDLRINPGPAGRVLTFDRFGNAISNLRPNGLPQAVEVAGRRLPFVKTFSDVPRGEALAYLGSAGLLEIAVNGGSAREKLELSAGAEVRLVTSSANRND